jgi:hypothetical protein
MTMDNMPSQWHFLVYFYTKSHHTLRHWIEHVNISRMVLFQLWKWSLWCCIVQNHLDVPKITKRDSFFSIQSWTSIFHDEKTSFMPFPGAKKARMMLLSSPKSTSSPSKTKKATDTQTKKQTHWYAKISKFKKFKISILTCTRTHNPTNQRCEKTHRENETVTMMMDIAVTDN